MSLALCRSWVVAGSGQSVYQRTRIKHYSASLQHSRTEGAMSGNGQQSLWWEITSDLARAPLGKLVALSVVSCLTSLSISPTKPDWNPEWGGIRPSAGSDAASWVRWIDLGRFVIPWRNTSNCRHWPISLVPMYQSAPHQGAISSCAALWTRAGLFDCSIVECSRSIVSLHICNLSEGKCQTPCRVGNCCPHDC
jgi:hypothetical protein